MSLSTIEKAMFAWYSLHLLHLHLSSTFRDFAYFVLQDSPPHPQNASPSVRLRLLLLELKPGVGTEKKTDLTLGEE